MSTDDLQDIIDYDALLERGHSDEEARWLLRHANRGTPDRPYLLEEEYEVALLDLQRLQGSDPG
jgi:hypothetical protein